MKRLSKRGAASVVWAWVSGELREIAGGESACMTRSEVCWVRGAWVGGVVWGAVALGRSWDSVLSEIVERSGEEW